MQLCAVRLSHACSRDLCCAALYVLFLWVYCFQNKEEMSWKKLTEKLICFNKYLFLVTQNQRKNAWRLGFVFLAEPALHSDHHIETCDICEKHLCRCYAARAPQDSINAAKRFRCQGCDNTNPRPQTLNVSPPQPHTGCFAGWDPFPTHD